MRGLSWVRAFALWSLRLLRGREVAEQPVEQAETGGRREQRDHAEHVEYDAEPSMDAEDAQSSSTRPMTARTILSVVTR